MKLESKRHMFYVHIYYRIHSKAKELKEMNTENENEQEKQNKQRHVTNDKRRDYTK